MPCTLTALTGLDLWADSKFRSRRPGELKVRIQKVFGQDEDNLEISSSTSFRVPDSLEHDEPIGSLDNHSSQGSVTLELNQVDATDKKAAWFQGAPANPNLSDSGVRTPPV